MEEQQKNQKKALFKVLYYALLGFFVLVFVFSAIYIADYMIEAEQTGSEYKNLQDQYEEHSRPPITAATDATEETGETGEPSTEGTEPSEPTDPPVPTEPTILPELQPFYEQNPELVGWIRIEGTDIHYPVVQSPERPNYYLDHTFEGRSSERGAIYVREACDVFAPSDNITIYGHHMKAGNKYGTMFRDLDGYRTNREPDGAKAGHRNVDYLQVHIACDGDWITPGRDEDEYESLFVRLMYREEGGMMVFYISAEFDDEPEEIEALVAVDMSLGQGEVLDATYLQVGDKITLRYTPPVGSESYQVYTWQVLEGDENVWIDGTGTTCEVRAMDAGSAVIRVTYEYTEDGYNVLTGNPEHQHRSATQDYYFIIE